MNVSKRVTLFLLAAVISLSFLPNNVSAEADGEIMFILDASSSMLHKDNSNKTRIDRAKEALVSTLQTLPATQRVGVRVYGSKVPDTNQVEGCRDSALISEPKANNTANLIQQVNAVQAKGWTLMSKSLKDVQADFKGEGPKTVILLSDGVDTCNPAEVCETAKNLSAAGTKIKVNTLGLVVNNEARAQLQCIAQNSGGTYYDVNDLDRLQKAITALTAQTVDLFGGKGVKIRGSSEILNSPALLADTLYTDTINGSEYLHYSFDALPKQKITFTLKGADNQDVLNQFNFLSVRGYEKLDASTLSSTGVFGTSQRFKTGIDTVTTVYKIDTEKQKIAEPRAIAFEVSIRSNKGSVPIQLQVTTEGGEAPNNKSIAENSVAKDDKKDNDDGFPLFLIILIAAALLAAALTTVYFVRKKRKQEEPPVPPFGSNPLS